VGTWLRHLYHAAVSFDREAATVVEFVARGRASGSALSVLDVGCGYGRYLRLLRDRGLDATGVDVNPEIVRANREAGLRCMTSEEFARSDGRFDAIVMSHVIEHFPPGDLVPFMDGYLDRLRVGGSVVIATPLMSRNFYDDFDHVKPYQPMGLRMVFGGDRAQVQYYARNRLALRDLWFRRSPWRPGFWRARYLTSPMTRVLQAAEVIGALGFRASAGLLGRTDGWVGQFEKLA